MDKKQMYVEVINSETGKIFSLPTLYTDRTEACVCGQNYMRDRQAEDPCSKLFFRVLLAEEEEEDDWDDEEPEHGESVYGTGMKHEGKKWRLVDDPICDVENWSSVPMDCRECELFYECYEVDDD